jgi:hypothetical protein
MSRAMPLRPVLDREAVLWRRVKVRAAQEGVPVRTVILRLLLALTRRPDMSPEPEVDSTVSASWWFPGHTTLIIVRPRRPRRLT